MDEYESSDQTASEFEESDNFESVVADKVSCARYIGEKIHILQTPRVLSSSVSASLHNIRQDFGLEPISQEAADVWTSPKMVRTVAKEESETDSDSSVEIAQQHLGFRSPVQPTKNGVDPASVFIGGVVSPGMNVDHVDGLDSFDDGFEPSVTTSREPSSFFEQPKQLFSPLEPSALEHPACSDSTSSGNAHSHVEGSVSRFGSLDDPSYPSPTFETIDPTLLGGRKATVRRKRKERVPVAVVATTHAYQTRSPEKRQAPRAMDDFVSTDDVLFTLEIDTSTDPQVLVKPETLDKQHAPVIGDHDPINDAPIVSKVKRSKHPQHAGKQSPYCHQCRSRKPEVWKCEAISAVNGYCTLSYCVRCIIVRSVLTSTAYPIKA